MDVAADLGLWAAAEDIAAAAIDRGEGGTAAETLVDAATARSLFRQADAFATRFARHCGPERRVAARLAHGRATITKVVAKRQLALVEKVVRGVDDACGDDSEHDARRDVRAHAIAALAAGGERALARDLNDAWTVRDGVETPLGFDDSADLAALDAAARRDKYVQWDELFPCEPPEPLASPGAFTDAVASLEGFVGFDVEWADGPGAALLQLATTDVALLVDVAALSATAAGADALRSAFDGALRGRLVGFGAAQDLSRLRATPRRGSEAWLPPEYPVVELQSLLKVRAPASRLVGLSAYAAEFLGKPLDKALQCSRWELRPLSRGQRIYAALDAVMVAIIYDKLRAER